MSGKVLSQYYQNNFSGDIFQNMVYSKVTPWSDFIMRNIFQIFEKGLVSGKRLLEIGAGPTIHISAIASKFCQTIVTSDLTESNREKIKLWLNNDIQAFDWTEYLKFCSELEGFRNVENGVAEIAERLRYKVQEVIFCDVTRSYPLEKSMEPFDVIVTSLCCEIAVQSADEYMAVIKNVGNVLKPKGKLVMSGAIGATHYVVGDHVFPACTLSEDLIKESFIRAGYRVCLYKESLHMDVKLPRFSADTKRYFVALFEKM